MKLNIFSIFDEKAEAYSTPFFQSHVGQALRSFSDLALDDKASISRHPQDYSLYHIGEFDPCSSHIISYPEPRLLARASEFTKHLVN